jgi:hypothetical protein
LGELTYYVCDVQELTYYVCDVQELHVDPDNTSSTRRKKESAEDSRPSAQGIGYFGLAFLCVVFGGIFLMDINILLTQCHDLFKRLKGTPEIA